MILNKKGAYRVRWWNIAYGILLMTGFIFVILVLKNTKISKDFLSNMLIEIVGFCIGLLITYIVYQRFRYERFKTLIGYSGFAEPFTILQELSVSLIPFCDLPAHKAKESLSHDTIKELKKNFEIINTKVNLYNRFITLEELREIDICLTNILILSEIDKSLEDNDFMKQFVGAILLIYIKSHDLVETKTDPKVIENLHDLNAKYVKAVIRNKNNYGL